MARAVDNSHHSTSTRDGAPLVAPYLTHVITHHGQLTLIPPQNAGRIRKAKTKPPRAERRREPDEPRFNTSVPNSSRRRTTSVRTQRQQPPTHRLPRDPDIPDYPPPSFLEAISTPPPFTPLLPPSVNSPLASTPTSSNTDSHSPVSRSQPIPIPSNPHSSSEAAGTARHLDAINEDHLMQPAQTSHTLRPAPRASSSSPTPHSRHQSPSPSNRPRSPLAQVPGSASGESDDESDVSSLEFVDDTMDDSQRWEVERRLGLPLEERVQREFVRLQTAESTAALVTPRGLIPELPELSPSRGLVRRRMNNAHAEESTNTLITMPRASLEDPPSSEPTADSSRCSRCGTLKPLDCSTIDRGLSISPTKSADDEETQNPPPSSARSQYGYGWTKKLLLPSSHRGNPPTSSPPTTPVTFTSSTASSSPWASSLTLASSGAMSPTKSSHMHFSLKRKESVILKKLFSMKSGSPKGKERERSSSPQDILEEPLENWEVVDPKTFETDLYSGRKRYTIQGDMVPKHKPSLSSFVSSSADTGTPAFLNRPVRPIATSSPSSPFSHFNHSRGTLSSPTSESSPRSPDLREDCDSLMKGKSRTRRPPPPPPPRKSKETSASPFLTEGDATPTPQPPLSLPVVNCHLEASSLAFHPIRPRVNRPLTVTVPQIIISNQEEAEPSAICLACAHSIPPSLPHTPNLPSSSFHLNSMSSSSSTTTSTTTSTPGTPTTPSRHYPGRPLPQTPHEVSPFGKPIYTPLQPSPSTTTSPSTPTPTPRTLESSTSSPNMSRNPEFYHVTDLDVLVSRLVEGGPDREGRNYEDLLLLSELAGPAETPRDSQVTIDEVLPLIAPVEITRRRTTKEGRVRVRLSLLGKAVDKCGVCLSQFRDGEMAGLWTNCEHAYHERCIQRWIDTSRKRTCPICREPLDAPVNPQYAHP